MSASRVYPRVSHPITIKDLEEFYKMSQHPSLRVDSVGVKHRNVLKRLERIKKLQEEGKWNDARTIYNLPKIKSLKIKVKKGGGKEKKEGEGEAAAGAAPAAAKTSAAKAPAAKADKK